MISYVITLEGHEYSEACAARCKASASHEIQTFKAVDQHDALATLGHYGLHWTWTQAGVRYCQKTGLRQHPYGERLPKIGCSMSHYLLWRKCVELDQPILILEHDSVFLRPLPEIEFNGICQINDPNGATHQGAWWSEQMVKRGPGVWPKTRLKTNRPDGLAGNSAYLVKPWAAQELINAFHEYGVWPNDATMCIQLFPYLQEYYPFITRVEQEQSTSGA